VRSITAAVEWARAMNGKPAPGGPGHCQLLVRTAYAIPAWAESARLAWEHTPKGERNLGPLDDSIPPGAFVYFPTLSQYGHVMLSLGKGRAVSNDYLASGVVSVVPVKIPKWHGAQHYGGYSMWTPFGVAR